MAVEQWYKECEMGGIDKIPIGWQIVAGFVASGLFWLSHQLYPDDHETLLILLAYFIIFEFLLMPFITRWFKDTVKEAMQEKQDEERRER